MQIVNFFLESNLNMNIIMMCRIYIDNAIQILEIQLKVI
jgi:hypothetical protein